MEQLIRPFVTSPTFAWLYITARTSCRRRSTCLLRSSCAGSNDINPSSALFDTVIMHHSENAQHQTPGWQLISEHRDRIRSVQCKTIRTIRDWNVFGFSLKYIIILPNLTLERHSTANYTNRALHSQDKENYPLWPHVDDIHWLFQAFDPHRTFRPSCR